MGADNRFDKAPANRKYQI